MKLVYSFINNHKLFQIYKKINKHKAYDISSYSLFINGNEINNFFEIHNLNKKNTNFILFDTSGSSYDIDDYELFLSEKIVHEDLYRMTDNDFKKIVYIANDGYYLNTFNEYYIKIEFPFIFCKIFPKYKFIL